MPYFEQILYSIPAEQFLKDVIANVISDDATDNSKATRKFEEIFTKAKAEYQKVNQGEDDDDYDEDEEDDDILTRLGL
jgi:hypothetical protein